MSKTRSDSPQTIHAIVVEPDYVDSDRTPSDNDCFDTETETTSPCYINLCKTFAEIIYFLLNFAFMIFISWGFYLASIEPWRKITHTKEGTTEFNLVNVLIGFCVYLACCFTILSTWYSFQNIYTKIIILTKKNAHNDNHSKTRTRTDADTC